MCAHTLLRMFKKERVCVCPGYSLGLEARAQVLPSTLSLGTVLTLVLERMDLASPES